MLAMRTSNRQRGWCLDQGLLTHATAKLRHILLSGLVLLVLVDPLVEVGSEEVNLLGLLEQAGPVGLVELLLLQLQLDILARVVDLGGLLVNLGVELELQVVSLLEGVGVAGKGQTSGLEVELEALLGHVGDGDGQVDEVLLGIGAGRALRPENYASACQQGKARPGDATEQAATQVVAQCGSAAWPQGAARGAGAATAAGGRGYERGLDLPSGVAVVAIV